MIPAQPSRTAVRTALRRAAHQVLDTPLVFEDPLAITMIGKEVAAALLKAPEKLESQAGAPALRAFLAVRSRIAEAAIEKARELVTLLTKWQQRSRLYLVAFGDIQQQVLLTIPGPMRVVVYRRLMLRIAERIGRARRAQALVTGDVVGQVASQTLENLAVVGAVTTMPLFRPLIGMDKDEITAEAQKIGTYPISIIEDQDCCTLFTPRNPVTRGRLAEVQTLEGALPIEEMVDRAVKSAVVEDFDFPVITSVGKTGGVEWEPAE